MKDTSLGSRVFDTLNYVFLILFALLTVLPFVYILSSSFSVAEELVKGEFLLFPKKLSLLAYEYIFSTSTLPRSLLNSVYITVVGTLFNMTLTVLMAYPLARKTLRFRSKILAGVIFTMLFSGGMIPTFIVVKNLGLINSYWALIMPGAISAFNLIVMKNFFQQIPEGLEESAKIDGCNDMMILIRIVLPLSLPAIATFSLFYAVNYWNAYFNSILYLNDSSKWPIQVLLRQIVILSNGGIGDTSQFPDTVIIPPKSIQMATIVVATLPILAVYPFLQRYFVKGVMLGSVKG